MASLEWERSSDHPPGSSLEALLAEARAARERMQQATARSIARAERLGARQEPATTPSPETRSPTAGSGKDRIPTDEAVPGRHGHSAVDWTSEHADAAVERLFALLEQNQAAIAALAQAWRHSTRVTRAQLAAAERLLAAETDDVRPEGDEGFSA